MSPYLQTLIMFVFLSFANLKSVFDKSLNSFWKACFENFYTEFYWKFDYYSKIYYHWNTKLNYFNFNYSFKIYFSIIFRHDLIAKTHFRFILGVEVLGKEFKKHSYICWNVNNEGINFTIAIKFYGPRLKSKYSISNRPFEILIKLTDWDDIYHHISNFYLFKFDVKDNTSEIYSYTT